jgi:GTPase SAR1 family protein
VRPSELTDQVSATLGVTSPDGVGKTSVSYRLTKALELASSEPTAGSVLGTLAKEIVRRDGAAGAVVMGGALVVAMTSLVVAVICPEGGVIAYQAAPTTTTIMISTAIAICELLFIFKSTPRIVN